MEAVQSLSEVVGKAAACRALAVPRASFYRWKEPKAAPAPRSPSPRALRETEQERVCQVLHAPEFVDLSPWSVYASLLDVGQYLCSVSTMYRILRQHDEVRERRNQLRHPRYQKPELLAERPNEGWT